MDYKAIARAITDPENQPHQWSDKDLADFFVSAANEIESLKQTVIERERQLVEREFQLIELRKMNEQNHEWGNELWEALHTIGYGPPHEGDPLELLNQFVELARTKVSPKEKQ